MNLQFSRQVLVFVSERMSDSNPIAASVDRLAKAVESLENSVFAKLDNDDTFRDAEAEVQRMGADRVRLAQSLDEAEKRSQLLAHTNKEVSRRLVDAMESIRSVLERENSG